MKREQMWGGQVPTVKPSDLLADWRMMHGISVVCRTQEMDFDGPAVDGAVWYRAAVLYVMEWAGLLKDWIQGGELDEAVIRVVAEFPLKLSKPGAREKAPFYDILNEAKRIKDMQRLNLKDENSVHLNVP